MSRLRTARTVRLVRHQRVRKKVSGTTDRPRLCVFRSVEHLYVQLIDDTHGRTLATATTLDAEVRADVSAKTKSQRAGVVGRLLAQRAQKRGVNRVVFDRGGYKYHGRVKALAQAARDGGLEF